MASLGGGLDRGGERALVTRGVGLEAIAIEQGSALSKLYAKKRQLCHTRYHAAAF